MELIKREIFTQNEALLKTHRELLNQKEALCAFMRQPFSNLIFIGCGSGYVLSSGSAALFSVGTSKKALAFAGGEVLLHPEKYKEVFTDALVITTSRSGETSEVIYSLRKMKEMTHFRTLGILSKENCTMKELADFSVLLPWSYDESVCQTRNISNFYYALTMLFAFYTADADLEKSLSAFLAEQSEYLKTIEPPCRELAQKGWNNVTTLADGEISGIAAEGALAFTEICILPGEHSRFLDYRHGPIVGADPHKLIIALLNGEEETHQKKLIADLIARGAHVVTLGQKTKDFWGSAYHIPLDHILRREVWGLPLINLCQVLSFYKALACGHDPDAPEGLNPFVKF